MATCLFDRTVQKRSEWHEGQGWLAVGSDRNNVSRGRQPYRTSQRSSAEKQQIYIYIYTKHTLGKSENAFGKHTIHEENKVDFSSIFHEISMSFKKIHGAYDLQRKTRLQLFSSTGGLLLEGNSLFFFFFKYIYFKDRFQPKRTSMWKTFLRGVWCYCWVCVMKHTERT